MLRRAIAPLPAPAALILSSIALFMIVAVTTNNDNQLSVAGLTQLLDRMAALGLVSIGQTFVIIAGSIDLSVANLISVAAVTASFVMQGRTSMILPGCALALAISGAVGCINGMLVAITR